MDFPPEIYALLTIVAFVAGFIDAIAGGGGLLTVPAMLAAGVDRATADRLAPHRVFPGNRPSSTIHFRQLDPYTLGRLIALYEHKVFVQGVIWGINSFDQWGVELGKTLARRVLPELSLDALPAEGQDGSTAGLIAHVKATRTAIDPPTALAQFGSPQP